MVPAPTSQLLDIIRLAWSPDASVQRLGALAAQDPVFSKCVLRYVNSSTFGIQSRVDNAQRAALLLGAKALGSLAVCYAAAEAVERADIDQDLKHKLNEDCLRRACAAVAIATKFPQVTPDIAVAIGFCVELGKLATILRDPSLSIWFDTVRGLHGKARVAKEREFLKYTHVEDFAAISAAWHLPRDITRPVMLHHEPGEPDERSDRLRQLAALSDVIAEVWTAADPQQAMLDASTILAESLGVSPKEAETMVSSVGVTVDEIADIFGVSLRRQPDLTQMLKHSDDGLDGLDRDDLVHKIEEMRAEKRTLTRHIEELKLRIQALTQQDMLTGLPTRQRYFMTLRNEIETAHSTHDALSCVLVDIDRQDEHNQRYGQAAGDEILRRVAATLQRMVRETDFVARTAGDCFGIILPRTDTAGGRVLAERIRAAIEMMKLDLGGQRILLSSTVIGLTLDPDHHIDAEQFHARIEAHLERNRGCNRASWAA
ncbi:MAG TPA: diguanylate cyclase [Myxococcota bacterium]|nr:diguanylate cyclase [Myxococcota bacterium]